MIYYDVLGLFFSWQMWTGHRQVITNVMCRVFNTGRCRWWKRKCNTFTGCSRLYSPFRWGRSQSTPFNAHLTNDWPYRMGHQYYVALGVRVSVHRSIPDFNAHWRLVLGVWIRVDPPLSTFRFIINLPLSTPLSHPSNHTEMGLFSDHNSCFQRKPITHNQSEFWRE